MMGVEWIEDIDCVDVLPAACFRTDDIRGAAGTCMDKEGP